MNHTGPKPRASLDLHLAVAAALNVPGLCWSDVELAEFCGCHHSRIQQVEKAALKKLRLRPSTMKLCVEMLRDAPRYVTLRRAKRQSQTQYTDVPRMAA